MIQPHGQHHQQRSSFPLCSVGCSSASFAFLSSCTSGLFFPASSKVFKSSILSPSHASLAAISTSTSTHVSRASSPFPSPASLPSNQDFVKPFSVIYNATTPFPPHPVYLSLPQPGQPVDPPTVTMSPQRPTHPRLHVQNTFDALKVLVSRTRLILPYSHSHSASATAGGRQNRRIATRHTTPDRPRAHLLHSFWFYLRLEGE